MFAARPDGVPLGVWRKCVWISFTILSSQFIQCANAEFSYEAITAVLARITITYKNPKSNSPQSVTAEIGRFADGTIGPAGGTLINPRRYNNQTSDPAFLYGCNPNWAQGRPETSKTWVALLLRGGCSDAEKVRIAMAQNASAVLLFGGDNETYLQKDTKFKGSAIVVYLLKQKGEQLSYLITNGTEVLILIARGQEVKFRITSINRTSVLFVSVSFIVLMVVSLAWLIFYYIQRFRYINAKDKLARHLCSVAKKALSKVPVKNLKNNDKEIEDTECCAVCIEQYQVSDTVRTLPCKHEFHKICVDPWLLEHRTCPMCKMDILKYFGFVSNNEGLDSRSNTRNEASVELGRGSNRDASNSRPALTHANPQVSVISQSEVPSHRDSMDRASSNPVGDGPLPHVRQPSSGFGATTTSVIRSMIQSARPRIGTINRTIEVEAEETSKVKDVGGPARPESTSANSEREAAETSSNEPASRETSDEGTDVQTSPDSPPVLTEGGLTSDITCDIEYLVKEIMDIDTESDSSPKSYSSTHAEPSAPPMVEPAFVPVERNPVSNHPKGIASSTSDLPAIECDSTRTLSLDDIPRSRRQSTCVSAKKSSLTDSEASASLSPSRDGGAEGPSSGGTRRPSSHLVTTSHS